MNYQLVVLQPVYTELLEIVDYYDTRKENLGLKFLSFWEETITVLTSNPRLYQKIRKNFRAIQVRNFPFLVIYEIVETNVIVYRVIHAKRKPSRRFKL